jgi:hypothetical protein
VTPEGIRIQPRGWHKFGSLSRGFTIPLSSIASVTLRPDHIRDEWKTPRLTKRKAGSFIPGVYKAGMFRPWGKPGNSDKSWWLVRNPEHTIELTFNGFRYDRVIVEVDDPASIAAQIQAAIGGGNPA